MGKRGHLLLVTTIMAAGPGLAQGVPTRVAPQSAPDTRIRPDLWPAVRSVAPDPAIEAQIDSLIARMSIDQKVGQTVQGDIASTTAEDVYRYHLGSVLNGGSSSPGGDEFAPPSAWVAAADEYWEASMRPNGDLPRIPVMWGTDAVHGHSNIVGATLFPHNIGLGAARDPEMMRRIGEVTAIELRVTGLDWTFAPTIAVARDARWGRTYESFGEDPLIVARYAAPYVEGLQGRRGDADWLRGDHVVATAKHFIADGGTGDGRDRGDAVIDEIELIRIHAVPYVAALNAGVQSVMASFSSWNGLKMHGAGDLLTGVLKRRWGFDGLLVGDWDGHAKVPGCTTTDCPQSMAAGLDMYMAPASWKGIYETTLAAVRSGDLSMARLDDAVRRILRVKLRAGLFEAPRPSMRPHAGRYELLGAPAHRAVAREAVAKSLVLLKNDRVLPLKPGMRLLVAGDAADSISRQSGGWTLTWQGTGTLPEHFPGATTIFAGIRDAARIAGGDATLSIEGRFTQRPDAAIIVFGEEPYAEFQGDRADLMFDRDSGALDTLRRLKAAGIPTVAIFLSGRPLWVNRHLNAADAFVAAWLPGSEGGGVADVLFGKRPFTGTLPMRWPADARAERIDRPLFPIGYGLVANEDRPWRTVPEAPGVDPIVDGPGPIFTDGRAVTARSLQIDGANDSPQRVAGGGDNGAVSIRPVDHQRQEDAREAVWSGRSRGTLIFANDHAQDLSADGPLAIRIFWRIDDAPTATVSAELRCGPGCSSRIEITPSLKAAAGKGWGEWMLPLSCLRGADLSRVTAPLVLSTGGRLRMTFSEVALVPIEGAPACP